MLDAFGGVGGNAVQLAATCKQTLVTDTSMERLLLAQHNSAIYGVSSRMDFICGDFLKLAPRFQVPPLTSNTCLWQATKDVHDMLFGLQA